MTSVGGSGGNPHRARIHSHVWRRGGRAAARGARTVSRANAIDRRPHAVCGERSGNGDKRLLTFPSVTRAQQRKRPLRRVKGPAESGQICSVGRRKIAKKIAKNKRCYANTLRPRSRMLLKVMKGG